MGLTSDRIFSKGPFRNDISSDGEFLLTVGKVGVSQKLTIQRGGGLWEKKFKKIISFLF